MLRQNGSTVELINLLKVFENDVNRIPWKMLTTEYYPISDHLEKIFSNHINIYTMSDADVENVLNFISAHTRNSQVKKLVVYKLIWKLRRSDTYGHQVIGQNLVNKHLFNIR